MGFRCLYRCCPCVFEDFLLEDLFAHMAIKLRKKWMKGAWRMNMVWLHSRGCATITLSFPHIPSAYLSNLARWHQLMGCHNLEVGRGPQASGAPRSRSAFEHRSPPPHLPQSHELRACDLAAHKSQASECHLHPAGCSRCFPGCLAPPARHVLDQSVAASRFPAAGLLAPGHPQDFCGQQRWWPFPQCMAVQSSKRSLSSAQYSREMVDGWHVVPGRCPGSSKPRNWTQCNLPLGSLDLPASQWPPVPPPPHQVWSFKGCSSLSISTTLNLFKTFPFQSTYLPWFSSQHLVSRVPKPPALPYPRPWSHPTESPQHLKHLQHLLHWTPAAVRAAGSAVAAPSPRAAHGVRGGRSCRLGGHEPLDQRLAGHLTSAASRKKTIVI